MFGSVCTLRGSTLVQQFDVMSAITASFFSLSVFNRSQTNFKRRTPPPTLSECGDAALVMSMKAFDFVLSSLFINYNFFIGR